MKLKNNRSSSVCIGIVLLVLGTFAALVILHRTCCYFYEYDPKFAPYDYGRFNFFSYFTIQSNIFVSMYLIIKGLTLVGVDKMSRLSNNPYIGSFVTTYIIVTGVVFCAGIPLGFTPPFTWDTPIHAMTSFIQIFHHMIIPSFMIGLWFFPTNTKKINHKYIILVSVYPLVYSLISIIRGALSNPHFYAYPFYNPEFDFYLIFRNSEYSNIKAYFSMLPLLVVGLALFVIVDRVVVVIYENRMKRLEK